MKYLKYVMNNTAIQKPIVVSKPPYYGKVPTEYRYRDVMLNGHWYTNNGMDISKHTDPFFDGSLVSKLLVIDDKLMDITSSTPVDIPNGVNVVISNTSDNILDKLIYNNIRNSTVIKSRLIPIEDRYTVSCRFNVLDDIVPTTIYSIGDTNNILTVSILGTSVKLSHALITGVELITEDIGEFLIKDSNNTITITVNKKQINLFVNAELVITKNLLIKDAKILDSYINISDSNIALEYIAMYNKCLTKNEVLVDYNQQHLDLVKCDGLEGRPLPFTYIEDNNKLVSLDTNSDGTINKITLVDKEGYVNDDYNFVGYNKNGLASRYGEYIPIEYVIKNDRLGILELANQEKEYTVKFNNQFNKINVAILGYIPSGAANINVSCVFNGRTIFNRMYTVQRNMDLVVTTAIDVLPDDIIFADTNEIKIVLSCSDNIRIEDTNIKVTGSYVK